jgi:hypothetical protein
MIASGKQLAIPSVGASWSGTCAVGTFLSQRGAMPIRGRFEDTDMEKDLS